MSFWRWLTEPETPVHTSGCPFDERCWCVRGAAAGDAHETLQRPMRPPLITPLGQRRHGKQQRMIEALAVAYFAFALASIANMESGGK